MKSFALLLAAVCGIVAGFVLSQSSILLRFAGRASGCSELVDASFSAAAQRAGSAVDQRKVEELISDLRAEARDEETWKQFLRDSHLTVSELNQRARDWIRTIDWIEARARVRIDIPDDNFRRFYEVTRESLSLPARMRVSHVFAAAPDKTTPDVIHLQEAKMQKVGEALLRGGDFYQFASATSEDEATKNRGGDLGWLTLSRAPDDFMAAANRLRVGETSGVIRTTLGFHILRLTGTLPARTLSFDESLPDIRLALANEARKRAVDKFLRVTAGLN